MSAVVEAGANVEGVPRYQLSLPAPSYAGEGPYDTGRLFEFAKMAERAGVDKLLVSDHVVFGERLEEYGRPEIGGIRNGVQPTGPDGLWLEPLVTLSVLAGMTTRIRLGTNILIAALRRPVVLAKAAATLDVLSGGRLDLGVGVGWQREEYEAAGLTFSGRGALLDQSLEVFQTLWRESRASYESAEWKVDGIHMMPKPVQVDGVPLWISGTVNPRVVKRIARFGTGWIPWGDAAADLIDGARQMKSALTAFGHDASTLRIAGKLPVVFQPDGTLDTVRTLEPVGELQRAGITDFRPVMSFGPDLSVDEEPLAGLVDQFRQSVGRPAPDRSAP